ncbi:glycosyl transferase family 1 [Isoptericola jiangsuensis]|uniref:Glycosyl transferase family 1 n=1 Tax=Isoptericola jiangsuensis TaxID=548579 RepID=A0A2A9F0Y7_9MICO|nr:glycosyltransferase family 4 protein [Isoptericola jiangsuensis]PFG44212.1 glycosyl transferase family 1 [Isoptericola jiangsuensis]
MAVPVGSHVHVITPGDHFSPSTGSAVPTVVHGLAGATPEGAPRTRVAVAEGTYPDHYPTAEVVPYPPAAAHRSDRYRDLAASRLGLARGGARRTLAPAVADQERWPPSVVVGHNMPQLVGLVDTDRHVPVLYAHNELLRSYGAREAGRTLDPAGGIVCVSAYVAERTAERLPPRLRDRVVVVHNAVDTTLFAPDDTPAGHDGLHVVFVGRMLPDKGPDLLVEALVRLARPDVRATFVGTTNFAPGAPLSTYEESLRAAASPLGDRVRWLPFRPRADVAAILRTADVVVVPSRWAEPFALTVLEGMASGAAVVAARVGGIPEATGDAGVLVAPGSPDDLAQAIEHLADDPVHRRRVQARGLAHARAHDWRAARRRFDEVLAELRITGGSPVPSSEVAR